MNKSELVAAVSARSGLSKSDASRAIAAFESAVCDALVSGDTVNITGFGTFKSVEVAERTGRNPKTGEQMTIAAHRSVKFKAGKTLKDAVHA